MIHITLGGLILFYLFVIFGGMLLLWFLAEVRRFFEERAWKQSQTLCRVCGLVYEDRTKEPLPVCPTCGHGNERGGVQRI
ncbi:MAG: hypothetical protein AAF191_20930 [Verrucomicrobiota bacterium]